MPLRKKNNYQRIYKSTFILLFIICACDKKLDNKVRTGDLLMNQFSMDEIEAISSSKIFFAHMSVGYNILEGILDIQEHDNRFLKINIKELSDDNKIDVTGILHKKIGNNGSAKLKFDAFNDMLINQGLGSEIDIVMLKLCYIDINEDTNIKNIFNDYLKTIDDINKCFPKLKIIHATVPLTTHSIGLKERLKNIIKSDISNVKRNQYNNLLRNKFADSDMVYDLAKIESTYANGDREHYKYEGERIYSLIGQYTYDKGHLNHLGRSLAAKELLRVISKVAMIK